MNYCFQVDNKEIIKIYESNDNFKIEYSEVNSDLCVIYFSSHGIIILMTKILLFQK